MSARRVMRNITKFIEEKLGLKVNITKSKIVKPNGLKYLYLSSEKWTNLRLKNGPLFQSKKLVTFTIFVISKDITTYLFNYFNIVWMGAI